MKERPRIALVSRELHPFGGGGIGPIVRAAAESLSEVADVMLVTTSLHRTAYEQRVSAGPLYPPGVQVTFVAEPPEELYQGFYCHLHAWSHRVFEALAETYGDTGPDLIEFPDYLGEGFVTLQAKRAAEPFLRDTLIAVRTHTTNEVAETLNGHLHLDLGASALREMERYCLRYADRLLWPGGDILESYRRFFGADRLAPATRIPDAFLVEADQRPAPAPMREPGGPLRLLYLGRMERRKGVTDLVEALLTMDCPDWELNLVGGDTGTGPLGVEMRHQLEELIAGDPRVRLRRPVARHEVGRLIDEHDAVVVPSRWECWPNVAREAFLHDRPVLSTPVGGLTELVRPGRSGWLARDTGVVALRELIEPFARDPAVVRSLAASGRPREVLRELTDPDRLRSAYLALIADRPPVAARPRQAHPDLVSVVIPYFQMDAFLEETLQSVAAQTYPRIETVIVNDGSLRARDRIAEDLADRYGARIVFQRNRGLGGARNYGITHARGRYVLPLDADNLIAPEFVERGVAALEADPDLAYVGVYSRFVDDKLRTWPNGNPGYAPLGNWSELTEERNVAGDACALIRRNVFDEGFAYSEDLTSYEDWLLYLQLRRAGRYGATIPRSLLVYRVRSDSMLQTTGTDHLHRLQGEIAALAAAANMRWTLQSA